DLAEDLARLDRADRLLLRAQLDLALEQQVHLALAQQRDGALALAEDLRAFGEGFRLARGLEEVQRHGGVIGDFGFLRRGGHCVSSGAAKMPRHFARSLTWIAR